MLQRFCPTRAAVGEAAGAVIRQGSRNDVVIFSADPNGGDLTRAAVDVNLEGREGDLTIATLTPGARYSVRMGGGSGRVQRIAIASRRSASEWPPMRRAWFACASTQCLGRRLRERR